MFTFVARLLLLASLLTHAAPMAWANGGVLPEQMEAAAETVLALPCHGGAEMPEMPTPGAGCESGCPCPALCAASVNEPLVDAPKAPGIHLPQACARYGEPAPAYLTDLLRPPNFLRG
jgi:hypothetical protein